MKKKKNDQSLFPIVNVRRLHIVSMIFRDRFFFRQFLHIYFDRNFFIIFFFYHLLSGQSRIGHILFILFFFLICEQDDMDYENNIEIVNFLMLYKKLLACFINYNIGIVLIFFFSFFLRFFSFVFVQFYKFFLSIFFLKQKENKMNQK